MKKRIALTICCFLIATALIPMSVSAKEVVLKLSAWGPSGHFIAKTRAVWIQEVNAAVAGKYKIVEYPGGQLYGPKDTHKAVAKGQVDLGVVLQPAMMGMVPMVQGVYLPFSFENFDQVAKAYSGESLEIIEKALKKKRMKLVYVSYLDPVHIFSNKGNIDKIEDFKGLRVLSTSPILTEILAGLGAAPDSSTPQTEQYMALKRSVADAMAQTIVGGYFQKSFEVAPYITKINMSYPTILVCMNLNRWNSLPKEVQDVMITAGKKQSAATMAASKGWEKKFNDMMAQAGVKITTLAPEERAKLKATSEPIWQKWADENGEEAKLLLELNSN